MPKITEEILAREQSHFTLVNSIRNAIATFLPEAGKEYEYSVSKVTRIMKIVQDIW